MPVKMLLKFIGLILTCIHTLYIMSKLRVFLNVLFDCCIATFVYCCALARDLTIVFLHLGGQTSNRFLSHRREAIHWRFLLRTYTSVEFSIPTILKNYLKILFYFLFSKQNYKLFYFTVFKIILKSIFILYSQNTPTFANCFTQHWTIPYTYTITT